MATLTDAYALTAEVVEFGDAIRQIEAATVKVFASDTAMALTDEAGRADGGYGHVRDYSVKQMLRDAKVAQIQQATHEIQRLVIARALL